MRFFYFMGLIFGAVNLYIFWRMRSAFGPGKWQWAALLFFAVMTALFMQRRAISDSVLGNAVSTLAFIWTGVALITVTWLLFLDAARILAWVADAAAGTQIRFILRPSRSVPAVFLLCFFLSLYALYEARDIRTTYLTFPTSKLPEGVSRLRLVAMTDVHIKARTDNRLLEHMAEAAKNADADILLMLGDFVDDDLRGETGKEAIFKAIPARFGKFAVLGNHEAYNGLENSLDFTTDAGFHVLREEAVEAGGIVIAGMDDAMFLAGRMQESATIEEKACLVLLRSLQKERDKEKFILLLRHRPGLHRTIAGLFDLQLSGHTHGGQIWPARFIAAKANGIASGMGSVAGEHGESALYVSPGTGTWGPPMRLFTPPEVTVIDLVKK